MLLVRYIEGLLSCLLCIDRNMMVVILKTYPLWRETLAVILGSNKDHKVTIYDDNEGPFGSQYHSINNLWHYVSPNIV